jgi:hypothetical protein
MIPLLAVAQQPAKSKTTFPSKPKLGTGSTQMVYTTAHDTCLDKKFSIVFYFIQDSANSMPNNHTHTLTAAIISTLNFVFKPICVSFENCSTVYIPVYPYNEWYAHITDQVVTSNWYTENTINFYLPTKVEVPYGNERDGYAHAPATPGALPSTKSVLVAASSPIPNAPTAFYLNEALVWGSTLLHIVGHFFGLPDTFLETGPPANPGPPSPMIHTYEYVRRTNCAINGDGICDTDADCYPVSYYDNALAPPKTRCGYDPGVKDGKGDFYTPPVDNYMSMWLCRCRFTQQQYNKMARFILQHRMNLH